MQKQIIIQPKSNILFFLTILWPFFALMVIFTPDDTTTQIKSLIAAFFAEIITILIYRSRPRIIISANGLYIRFWFSYKFIPSSTNTVVYVCNTYGGGNPAKYFPYVVFCEIESGKVLAKISAAQTWISNDFINLENLTISYNLKFMYHASFDEWLKIGSSIFGPLNKKKFRVDTNKYKNEVLVWARSNKTNLLDN